MRVLLAGLWSRRGLNVACLMVAVVAVTAALLGPMYGRASAEHLLDTRIDQRAPYTTGLTFQVPASQESDLPFGTPKAYRPPDPQLLIGDARAATQGSDWDRYWQRRTPWLYDQGGQMKFGPFLFEVPLYWRQGMCSLADVSGRCPTRPGEALVQQTMARAMGIRPGDVVPVRFTDQYTYELHDKDGTRETQGTQDRTVVYHMVGTYTVPHPSSSRWYDLSRFTGIANLRPPPTGTTGGGSLPHTPALLVAPGSMTSETFVGGVDLPIDTAAVNLDSMSATRRAANRFVQMALDTQDPNTVAELDLNSVFGTVRAEHVLLSRLMLAALAPFVVLALLLLFALVSAAAEVRRPSLALAKLRGHTRAQVLRFAVAEPAMVVLVAAVVSVVGAFAAAHALARMWLSASTPVVADRIALGSFAVVVAAALLASALAGLGVVREPLGSALSPPTGARGSSRAGLVLRSAVVAVAVASVAQLLTSGHQGSQLLGLIAPLFIALAVAVAGGVLLRMVSRWWVRRTTRARGTAPYLASRRLARRRDLANLMVPLLLAVSVIAFAGATSAVSGEWRDSRAAAEVGAARTYLATVPPGRLLQVTHRVDPRGRYLMAAVVDNTGDDMSRRVFLDTSRLATVAAWDPSWSSVPVGELQHRLSPPARSPVRFSGSRIGMRVADVHLTSKTHTASELWLQYLDPDGEQHRLRLGALHDGSVTLHAMVTGCAEGCTVQQLYVSGPGMAASDAQGRLTLLAVTVDGQPADWRLHDHGAWRPARPFPVSLVDPPVSLTATAEGLRIGVFLGRLPVGTGAQPAMVSGLARITPTATPDVEPVLVTRDTATSRPTRQSTAMAIQYGPDVVVGTSLNGAEVPMRVVGRTRALPWVGRVGAVADLGTALDEFSPLLGQVVDVQLWTAPHTPPSILAAVRDAGVPLSPASSLASRSHDLHTDAFSVGMRLFLIVGVATLLLAVFGVLASAVLQSRWRAYEVAALRVVGVPRRSLVRASVLEYVVMLGVAAALGVVSALLSLRLVLPAINLGPADEFDPTPVYAVHWAIVGGVGVGVLVIATGIALVVSRRIARMGRPSTLRWAEQG